MKRVTNPDLVRWVVEERDRACLFGFMRGDPCKFGLDPHHITPRSAGGGDTEDNIITLCRKHHDMAEEHRITPDELRLILKELYGYGRTQHSIWEYRRRSRDEKGNEEGLLSRVRSRRTV